MTVRGKKSPDDDGAIYRSERDLPDHPELRDIVLSLKSGAVVDDRDVDRLFPKTVQKLARTHWTSAEVARCAAAWLAPDAAARVLDVGSGAGKFCLVGAAATPGHFTGVELHPSLARVAHDVAKKYRFERVRFLPGDALAIDWASYSGLYLFNPFAEGLDGAGTEQTAYLRQIEQTTAKLNQLASGTRLAVFFGFGADVPATFQLLGQERFGSGTLDLWQQR